MGNKVEIQVAVVGAQAAAQQLAALGSGSTGAGSPAGGGSPAVAPPAAPASAATTSPAATAAAATAAAVTTAAATRSVGAAAQSAAAAAQSGGRAAAAAVGGIGTAAAASQNSVLGLVAKFAGFGEAGETINRLSSAFPKLSDGITKASGAMLAFSVGWQAGKWLGDVTGLNNHMQQVYGDVFYGANQEENAAGDADAQKAKYGREYRKSASGMKDWDKEKEAFDIVQERWKKAGRVAEIHDATQATKDAFNAEVKAEKELQELYAQRKNRGLTSAAQRDEALYSLRNERDQAGRVSGKDSDKYLQLDKLVTDATSGALAKKYLGTTLTEQIANEKDVNAAALQKLQSGDDWGTKFFDSVKEGSDKITDLKKDLAFDAQLANIKGDKKDMARAAAADAAFKDGTLLTLGGGDYAKGLSKFNAQYAAFADRDQAAAENNRRGAPIASMAWGSREAASTIAQVKTSTVKNPVEKSNEILLLIKNLLMPPPGQTHSNIPAHAMQ